jgi:hypothetical protein
MAGGPYKRVNGWQIKWRENGVWQSESLMSELDARLFKHLVEEAGNRWSQGWIKGHGFLTDEDLAPYSPSFSNNIPGR